MERHPVHGSIDAAGIAWLVIDRPERHNAFDDALIALMTRLLADYAVDDRVTAVVIKAEGKSFSAGADLDWMRRMGTLSFGENVNDAQSLARLLLTLDGMPKPTIGAVQGSAYGGGVGLIAACDVAIAVERATFALTEVRLGLIPAVISPFVIRAIGARQARRYMITGEPFSAEEARRIGLVHQVVQAEALDGAVDATLAAVSANGTEAMAAAKRLVTAVSGRTIDVGLMDDVARRIAEARASEEARRRIAAFLQRRAAREET